MSAKQELIATALTAAGSIRWQYPELSDELREACARAMVQPAAPDMGEVERLLEAYDREYASGGSVEDYDCARTALLDYVRGHFVGPNKIVVAKCDGNHGGPRCADPECWNDEATHQPISAADVPMPEPNYDGYDLIDRFLRNNLDDDDYAEYVSGLQQYGDAREAAGYARGLSEVNTALNDVFSAADGLSSAIDAALRGEVK